jgi:hypothetical protein
VNETGTPSACVSVLRCVTAISACGSWNGSGRSSTASTTLKIVELAPIPSASVSAAIALKPGLCASRRSPYRASSRNVPTVAILS